MTARHPADPNDPYPDPGDAPKMEAAEVKATSLKMIEHLPDDPSLAVTVSALSFAHVVVATGCDDDTAIECLRKALKQMRRGNWWLDA